MRFIKKNWGTIFVVYSIVAFVILYSILHLAPIYTILAIVAAMIVSNIIFIGNFYGRIGTFVYFFTRKAERANRVYAKAVAKGTTNKSALSSYAYYLLRNGDFEQSKEIYLTMLPLSLPIVLRKIVQTNIAVCDWKLKNYDESIERYEDLMLEPKYARQISAGDFTTLGFVCIEAGEYEKGEQYTRRALELNPDSGAAYDNLGQMCFFQKDYMGAGEYFATALRKKPTIVESNYYLGCLFAMIGDFESAVEYIEYLTNVQITALNTITAEDVQNKLEEIRELANMTPQEQKKHLICADIKEEFEAMINDQYAQGNLENQASEYLTVDEENDTEKNDVEDNEAEEIDAEDEEIIDVDYEEK